MSVKLFNNLLMYRITSPLTAIHLHDDLNAALAEKAARLPTYQELLAVGFNEMMGEEGTYIEQVNAGTMLLAVNFAERMLPGKIVRQRVAARVKQIEADEDRRVYAREKNQIKDSVIAEMLPHTFVDQKIVHVLIQGPYIIIDTTSAKKGEEILCLLREALGSLGVRPVTVENTPIQTYTDWFTGRQKPEKFSLTGDFKAISNDDEIDSLNGKGTSPETEGLSELVEEYGRRVVVLGLSWETGTNESMTFTVNEMLGIKGIKWPDSISDMAAADAGEEADLSTLFRATILLLASEIHTLMADLLTALGGENVPDDGSGHERFLRSLGDAMKNVTHINGRPVGGAADVSLDELDDLIDETVDPLYLDAKTYVRESKRANVTALQRKFKIGYNRAARLIDAMEEEGVITEMDSSGARQVISVTTEFPVLGVSHKLQEADEDEVEDLL